MGIWELKSDFGIAVAYSTIHCTESTLHTVTSLVCLAGTGFDIFNNVSLGAVGELSPVLAYNLE